MRKQRLLPWCLCSVLAVVASLALIWGPTIGIADGTPVSYAEGEAPEHHLYATPVVPGEEFEGQGTQTITVNPLELGPNERYSRHSHLGASILVVASGEICIAQRDLGAAGNATVTVVRKDSTVTPPDASKCAPVATDCPNNNCTYVACPGTCSIHANESFWLGPGDKVVQSSTTEHSMYNVTPDGGTAVMRNVTVITWGNEGGCAGDCL